MTENDKIVERELLLALQQGSRQAFEQIYHMYALRLTAKLIQLVKSEEIAQDLLQDIFIKIWEMRSEIQIDRSFSAFLYTIATNLSYNSFRSAIREQNRLSKLNNKDSYSHVEEDLEFNETHHLFEEALQQLTARQREVYTMHKLDGKSYKEISESLQISHSAINQHIQAANKLIKSFMKSRLPSVLFVIIPSLFDKYM
jgi:RNA polymerase sigma-70 factor (ECF subfamily)